MKIIEKTCFIEKKTFVKDDKEFTYYSFVLDMDGEKIRLALNSEDKKLFKYLIENYKGGNE